MWCWGASRNRVFKPVKKKKKSCKFTRTYQKFTKKQGLEILLDQWFSTMFLESPQHWTFCISPLSDKPISGFGVSTNELMTVFRQFSPCFALSKQAFIPPLWEFPVSFHDFVPLFLKNSWQVYHLYQLSVVFNFCQITLNCSGIHTNCTSYPSFQADPGPQVQMNPNKWPIRH